MPKRGKKYTVLIRCKITPAIRKALHNLESPTVRIKECIKSNTFIIELAKDTIMLVGQQIDAIVRQHKKISR